MTRTDATRTPAKGTYHDHGQSATDKALAGIVTRLDAIEKDAAVTKALLLAVTGGSGFHPPASTSPDYTAVGFGKDALSATARSDYHVTDSGNGTGTGTLRAALSASNRNIIFDVSSVALATAELQLDNLTNIVIDGSSRSDGVTISGQALRFDGCRNIVIRDIAFRDCATQWEGALQFRDYGGSVKCQDILIDRCSFSGYAWRGVDITEGSHNITVQWCFFGPCGNYGGSPPAYNYPAYVGDLSDRVSFDHCVFYNCEYRQPLATYRMDPVTGDASVNTTMDVANGIVYNTLSAFPASPGYYTALGAKNGAKVNVRTTYFHAVANRGDNFAIFSEQESGAPAPGIYQSGCKFKADAGSLVTSFPSASAYSTTGYDLTPESTATVAAQNALAYAGRYPRDATDEAYAAAISVT